MAQGTGPGGQKVTVEIDGIRLTLALAADAAPATTSALMAMLPLRSELIHAMWSGPVCLTTGVRLGDLPLENAVSFLGLGDVVYHPTHHEIGFAYDATQFREPIGSVYVTAIGRLEGDLAALANFGRRLQRTGARPIKVG